MAPVLLVLAGLIYAFREIRASDAEAQEKADKKIQEMQTAAETKISAAVKDAERAREDALAAKVKVYDENAGKGGDEQ